MDLNSALSSYVEYLEKTRMLGDPKGPRLEIERFTRWAGDQVADTTDLTSRIFETYAREVHITDPERARAAGRKKPLGEKTANLYKTYLRSWVRWLRDEGALGDDQSPERRLLAIKNPKPVRQKTFLHRDQLPAAREHAARWHPRDAAWIDFQHFMTRRWNELSVMHVWDLDLTPYPEFPFGFFTADASKGGVYARRHQVLPEFVPIAQRWLEDYALVIGRPLEPDDYLIPAVVQGKGWIQKGMRRPMRVEPKKPVSYAVARRIAKDVGAQGTHDARRGGGSAIRRDYGIRAAKAALDHKSELTTEGYMDLDRETLDFGALIAQKAEKDGIPVGAAHLSTPDALSAPAGAAQVFSLTERRRRRFSAS